MTSESFAPSDGRTGTAANGQVGHEDLIAHTERFARRLWEVGPGVWCPRGFACTARIIGVTLERLDEPDASTKRAMADGEFRASLSTQ